MRHTVIQLSTFYVREEIGARVGRLLWDIPSKYEFTGPAVREWISWLFNWPALVGTNRDLPFAKLYDP